MKLLLVTQTRNKKGQVARTEQVIEALSFKLGRGAECAIHLPDPRIALDHATIGPGDDGSMYIEADDGAVSVDGSFERRTKLRNGQRILVGPYEIFVFEAPKPNDLGLTLELVDPIKEGEDADFRRNVAIRPRQDQGIKYAGSIDPPATIGYLGVKGKKVALIAFGHNNGMPNVNDLEGAKQLVIEANKKADIVIISFHGGAEGTNAQNVPNRNEIFLGENRGNLPAFTHAVVDAGADIVLGHGPHVMRGMEMYKDRLIVYSMGNFCTYGWFQLAGETALSKIVEAKLAADGKFISGKINAVRLEGRGTPVLDEIRRLDPRRPQSVVNGFRRKRPKDRRRWNHHTEVNIAVVGYRPSLSTFHCFILATRPHSVDGGPARKSRLRYELSRHFSSIGFHSASSSVTFAASCPASPTEINQRRMLKSYALSRFLIA